MTYANGDEYRGDWSGDVRQGSGTYTWKDGGQITCSWSADQYVSATEFRSTFPSLISFGSSSQLSDSSNVEPPRAQ
eukprot:gene21949-28028_t